MRLEHAPGGPKEWRWLAFCLGQVRVAIVNVEAQGGPRQLQNCKACGDTETRLHGESSFATHIWSAHLTQIL